MYVREVFAANVLKNTDNWLVLLWGYIVYLLLLQEQLLNMVKSFSITKMILLLILPFFHLQIFIRNLMIAL